MQLAVVTPLDARSTGVADYSRDLLPHLARAAGGSVIVYGEDETSPLNLGGEGWVELPHYWLDERGWAERQLDMREVGHG
jgi:hypothetical protein